MSIATLNFETFIPRKTNSIRKYRRRLAHWIKYIYCNFVYLQLIELFIYAVVHHLYSFSDCRSKCREFWWLILSYYFQIRRFPHINDFGHLPPKKKAITVIITISSYASHLFRPLPTVPDHCPVCPASQITSQQTNPNHCPVQPALPHPSSPNHL